MMGPDLISSSQQRHSLSLMLFCIGTIIAETMIFSWKIGQVRTVNDESRPNQFKSTASLTVTDFVSFL